MTRYRRTMTARLGMMLSTLLLVFAVLDAGSALAVVASVAAVAITAAVAAQYAAGAARRLSTAGPARSHARRQSLRAVPAPQHPHTPGRRRSRAPSRMVAATV